MFGSFDYPQLTCPFIRAGQHRFFLFRNSHLFTLFFINSMHFLWTHNHITPNISQDRRQSLWLCILKRSYVITNFLFGIFFRSFSVRYVRVFLFNFFLSRIMYPNSACVSHIVILLYSKKCPSCFVMKTIMNFQTKMIVLSRAA